MKVYEIKIHKRIQPNQTYGGTINLYTYPSMAELTYYRADFYDIDDNERLHLFKDNESNPVASFMRDEWLSIADVESKVNESNSDE